MNEYVIEMGPGPTSTVRWIHWATGAEIAAGSLSVADAQAAAPQGVLGQSTLEMETAGDKLFALLSGALGAELMARLDSPEQERFYLDIRPPELYALPWEALRFPKPGPFGGVVPTWVREAHHLSRVYKPTWSCAPKFAGPIRVLIVVGADDASKDVEPLEEIAGIRRGIQSFQRTIDIEVKSRPVDLNDLHGAIRAFRPHVLHFIGHGDTARLRAPFDWKTGDLVALGKPQLEGWTPRLVFLNACRSNTNSAILASMAGAFLANGAVATIAMQGDIKGAAAGQLAGTFYARLASGEPVDRALTIARGVVRGGFAARESTYPALTLTTSPECVLPRLKGEAELGDYSARLVFCPYLPKMRSFVNQVVARRQLCGGTWPPREDTVKPAPFLLLRGGSGYGKTLLSAWLLDLCLRTGRNVRYVRVQPEIGGSIDPIELMRRIWGTPEAIAGRTSPLMCRLDLDPQGDLKLQASLDAGKDTATVFEKFRLALRTAASAAPLVIALDEFNQCMQQGHFRQVWEHLFAYLGTDQLRDVSLVLALSDNDYQDYVKQENLAALAMQEVPLSRLAPDEFAKAFRDYLDYRDETPAAVSKLLAEIVTAKSPEWGAQPISQIEQRMALFEGFYR